MHELAIAQNILEIVNQSVPEEQAAAVRLVRIRIGQLSGVVPESLLLQRYCKRDSDTAS
jgi:Zn finger protein HypA/HybF involved in hydrogenase expression